MRVLIFLTAYLLCTVNAAPQFVTFDDGKIGVNFGGYHASAGLGGLLTGNSAHGGLSASAGTPWGQNAAAGLGGSVDGRSSGFGYAGAQANPSVGASAVLGGSAGERGFIGSEAHVNGKAHTNTITSAPESHRVDVAVAPALENRFDGVQIIKPHKKYSLIKSRHTVKTHSDAGHSKHLTRNFQKSVNIQSDAQYPEPPAGHDPVALHNIFNIPIGILRTIQDNLTGIQVQKKLDVSR